MAATLLETSKEGLSPRRNSINGCMAPKRSTPRVPQAILVFISSLIACKVSSTALMWLRALVGMGRPGPVWIGLGWEDITKGLQGWFGNCFRVGWGGLRLLLQPRHRGPDALHCSTKSEPTHSPTLGNARFKSPKNTILKETYLKGGSVVSALLPTHIRTAT